jgi:hypothetical protein
MGTANGLTGEASAGRLPPMSSAERGPLPDKGVNVRSLHRHAQIFGLSTDSQAPIAVEVRSGTKWINARTLTEVHV